MVRVHQRSRRMHYEWQRLEHSRRRRFRAAEYLGTDPCAPLTVEARVAVESGEAFISAGGGMPALWLTPDQIGAQLAGGQVNWYPADLSEFQTVRLAVDSSGGSSVWMDGVLLCSAVSSYVNTQTRGPQFGAEFDTASNSYWDYVAYSNAFLPVPEPSSVLPLAAD